MFLRFPKNSQNFQLVEKIKIIKIMMTGKIGIKIWHINHKEMKITQTINQNEFQKIVPTRR